MKTSALVVLVVLLRDAAAVIHTLMFYEAASQGVPDFPEYEAVGRLNGVEFAHFDVEKKQGTYTQDWTATVAAQHPRLWDKAIGYIMAHQVTYKDNLHKAEEKFRLKVIHTLMFYEAASQGVPDFPEYGTVGRLNGVEFAHFDVEKKQAAYTQDWTDTVAAQHPRLWDKAIGYIMAHQLTYKDNLHKAEEKFRLKGVRMFQVMVGCHWNDQTDERIGLYQDAYDGEDFLSFDLEKMTWVAAKQEASFTKEKWNSERVRLLVTTVLLNDTCIRWMKILLEAGHTVVNRTEPPSVSFLQRTPTSPIRCSATGFFPKRVKLFWRKDGKELDQNVEKGVVLPNHDGTFQTAADLTLPPDQTDLHRYDCVFQFTEHKEELLYKLNRNNIRTNHRNEHIHTIVSVPIVCGVIIIMLGLVVYRKKRRRAPVVEGN